MSLYRIAEDKANLDDVLLGLAAARDNPSNIDFVLIEEGRFENLGIELKTSPGHTPAECANNHHVDAVIDSAGLVLSLAASLAISILAENTELDSRYKKDVERLLLSRSADLKVKSLKPGIRKACGFKPKFPCPACGNQGED